METAPRTRTKLDVRRRRLGISVLQLARLGGVRPAVVRRVLRNPANERFQNVQAVARVLGWDALTGRRVAAATVLHQRARLKAEYVAKLVQGTQALEAAALDTSGLQRIVDAAFATLLAGDKRKLWDD